MCVRLRPCTRFHPITVNQSNGIIIKFILLNDNLLFHIQDFVSELADFYNYIVFRQL